MKFMLLSLNETPSFSDFKFLPMRLRAHNQVLHLRDFLVNTKWIFSQIKDSTTSKENTNSDTYLLCESLMYSLK